MSDCQILANGDVSGIGIRFNLYATVLLMALIPDIPGRTAPLVEVLAENAGISGFALLITAIHETRQGKLSLYHAIFIIHLLYFTGIMVAPAGHYKHNSIKRRAILSGVVTYGCYLIFTVYALYVWGKGTRFGDDKSFTCSGNTEDINGKIEYIFFFFAVHVSATWLRVVWMSGLGVSLAFLVFFPVFGCILLFKQGVVTRSQPSQPRHVLFRRALWFGKILTAVYGVATLELYEKRNLQNGVLSGPEDDWSFGQVFALVQLVTTLNEAIHCFMSMDPEPSHSANEDRGSMSLSRVRNSTASSRMTSFVRFGVDLRTGGNDSREPTPEAGETSNLDTKKPEPTYQPVFPGQTQGGMSIV